MEPPEFIVSLACDIARRSPCAKSKRGVVIYNSDSPAIIHGTGFNGPPRPFKCDGSAACRKDCGVLCMHAEMRAVLTIVATGSPWAGEPMARTDVQLHLVHVKVDDAGKLVAGKSPCCELCSRMVLDVGIETVWLYEAAVFAPAIDRNNEPTQVEVQGVGWQKYTAAEFHRTLEALRIHVSKEENVHRFYRQHRSRYCAACGEEDYHPVHRL